MKWAKHCSDKGNEYGSTTGRPRRCGWLDIPALKYAIAINGVTELMMMKADILSGLDEVKVCTGYLYKGKEIDFLPYKLDADLVEPDLRLHLPGWSEDLTQMKSADRVSGQFCEVYPVSLKKSQKHQWALYLLVRTALKLFFGKIDGETETVNFHLKP